LKKLARSNSGGKDERERERERERVQLSRLTAVSHSCLVSSTQTSAASSKMVRDLAPDLADTR
jgi:hypothetical protein